MSILYSYDLDQRYMVKVNGGGIKAIELRQNQIEKEKDIIFNDIQIKLYELMIREKTLSDIYNEIQGDKQ